MKTIGIYQSVSNRPSVEHKCLNNTKYIYQHARKWDYQRNLKGIIDDAMVFTPEEVTDFRPSLCITQTTVKKPSAWKSLFIFTNIFDVKNRTTTRRVESAESKRKAVTSGNSLWTNKTKQKGH